MNTITVDTNSIPAPVMSAHCRTLLDCIGDYFETPSVQAEFEAWHRQQYGHPPVTASYIKEGNR